MSDSVQNQQEGSLGAITSSNLRVWIGMGLLSLGGYLFEIEAKLQLPLLLAYVTLIVGLQIIVPVRWQRYMHVLFSVVAMVYLFGWQVALGVCLFLFILCLLYLSNWNTKVMSGMVGLMLCSLVGIRVGVYESELAVDVATVLGILLMFRVVIMMYDRSANNLKLSALEFWNYLLIMPNLLIVIFPIIDTKMFSRSYKANTLALEKGFLWVARGLYYLLLYRMIYYYMLPDQSEVSDAFGFVWYCVLSYLLVYRLIGLFYISAGLMCLFGYDLPKVFKNMFFADGFNDLWRRLNVYWKDFILKIFYLPLYFRLRGRLKNPVFILFVLIFVVNWFLHGYQWFWILGTFPIRDTDIIFWTLFGVLLGINAVVEKARKGREERSFVIQGARVGFMFMFMSLFWTFWASSSVREYQQFALAANGLSLSFVLVLCAFIVVIGLGSGLIKWIMRQKAIESRYHLIARKDQVRVIPWVVLFFVLLGLPRVKEQMVVTFGNSVGGIFEERLNSADSEKEFQGYYEELLDGNGFDDKLSVRSRNETKPSKKMGWTRLQQTGIIKSEEGLLEKSLLPNQSILFKGQQLTSNEWGQRDRSNYYSKVKSDSVVRIALIGGSVEMGAGVADGSTFENLLEDTLNQISGVQRRVEIINFAISGIHMPQHVARMRQVVDQWDVDVVMYCAHPNERSRSLRSFAKMMYQNRVSSSKYLDELRSQVLDSLGGEDVFQFYRYLRKHKEELYNWGLDEIKAASEAKDVKVIWLYVPTLGLEYVEDYDRMRAEVENRNMQVIDISMSFNNQDKKGLAIDPTDRHPNARGHYLLFQELFRRLDEVGLVEEWVD